MKTFDQAVCREAITTTDINKTFSVLSATLGGSSTVSGVEYISEMLVCLEHQIWVSD
jgi:hypothetical protein